MKKCRAAGLKINMLVIVVMFGVVIFTLGWFSTNVYSFFTDLNKEKPFSIYSNELKSPGNWIKENQVLINKNEVTILIPNATWSTFTDTNSMDPVFDAANHAIKLKPKDPSELKVGDIVSYESDEGIIIHRIIDKGVDEQGVYFIAKGDNNKHPDPWKIRFGQITGVVVGILY